MTYIYGLSAPGRKTIRYIGKTANMKQRLGAHVAMPCNQRIREWIGDLDARGLRPKITVLRACMDARDASVVERDYIKKYAKRGLLNGAAGGGGRPPLPLAELRNYRYTILVDQDESRRLDRAARAFGADSVVDWIRDTMLGMAHGLTGTAK